jgi:hypothetical protein
MTNAQKEMSYNVICTHFFFYAPTNHEHVNNNKTHLQMQSIQHTLEYTCFAFFCLVQL